MEKDEISMSWNKKVSLKEIAQFYENKLRELDAKQNMLEQEIEKALQKIGQKTQELENSIENIKKFVDKLNETQEHIKNLSKEINEKNQSLDDRIDHFDKIVTSIINEIGLLRNALREFIIFQTVENEEFDLSMKFIMGIITPKDIEEIKNLTKYIEAIQSTINSEDLKNKIFIKPIKEVLNFSLEKNHNISSIVQPNEQLYEYLLSIILKSHFNILSKEKLLLKEISDIIKNEKGMESIYELASIFNNNDLFNIRLNILNIDKNKIKDEKEGLK